MSGLAGIYKALKTAVDIDKHPVNEATRLMGDLKCYSESNEINREVEQFMHSELSRLIEAQKLYAELTELCAEVDMKSLMQAGAQSVSLMQAKDTMLLPAHFDPVTGQMEITVTPDMQKLNEQANKVPRLC